MAGASHGAGEKKPGGMGGMGGGGTGGKHETIGYFRSQI